MESKCPCRIRRFLPEGAHCAGKDCLRPKRTHYAGKAVLCRNFQGVIMQVSPKYLPSIYQVSPKEVGRSSGTYSAKPLWKGADGKQQDRGIVQIDESRKISDLKKIVSFADFWKKGLFFEVDSIVTFFLDKKSNQSAAADKTWIFLLKRPKFLQRKHPNLRETMIW